MILLLRALWTRVAIIPAPINGSVAVDIIKHKLVSVSFGWAENMKMRFGSILFAQETLSRVISFGP